MKDIKNIKLTLNVEYFEELLKMYKLNKHQVARTIGTSYKVIWNWCHNLYAPSLELLYKVSLLLEVPMEDLLREVYE